MSENKSIAKKNKKRVDEVRLEVMRANAKLEKR